MEASLDGSGGGVRGEFLDADRINGDAPGPRPGVVDEPPREALGVRSESGDTHEQRPPHALGLPHAPYGAMADTAISPGSSWVAAGNVRATEPDAVGESGPR